MRARDVPSSVSGGAADARGDTRCFCARDLGLYAVVDALGPTYGGWHRPTGAGPAWNALLSRLRRGQGVLRDVVLQGLEEANQAALATSQQEGPIAYANTHSTLSLALIALQEGSVVAAGVGNCRVYMRRAERWTLRVAGQTLASTHGARGLPVEMQSSPSQLLGYQPSIEPEIWTDTARPGDMFYLCSAALWSEADAIITSHQGDAAALAADCAALDVVRGGGAAGYAVGLG